MNINERIAEMEKMFFEKFGANKIWVAPSKDNVETILEINSFIRNQFLLMVKDIGEGLRVPISEATCSHKGKSHSDGFVCGWNNHSDLVSRIKSIMG